MLIFAQKKNVVRFMFRCNVLAVTGEIWVSNAHVILYGIKKQDRDFLKFELIIKTNHTFMTNKTIY